MVDYLDLYPALSTDSEYFEGRTEPDEDEATDRRREDRENEDRILRHMRQSHRERRAT